MVNPRCVVPRGRTKYTTEQIQTLEKLFSQSQYPDTNTLEELADKIDVTLDKVAIWFQNRRSKFKKQAKDGHVTWMRRQIFQRENLSQSEDGNRKDGNSNCHVLSPPSEPTPKPKSNLHYLPTDALSLVDSSEYPTLGSVQDSRRGNASISSYQGVLSRRDPCRVHGGVTGTPSPVSQHFPSTVWPLERTPSPMHLRTPSPSGMLANPTTSLCSAPPASWYAPSPSSMRTASPASWHTPPPSSMLNTSRASLNTPPLANIMRTHSPAGMRTPSPDQGNPAYAPFLGNFPQHPLRLCHLLNDMRQQEETRGRCTSSVSPPAPSGADASAYRPLTPFGPCTPLYASPTAYSQRLSPWCYPLESSYTPGLPPLRNEPHFPSSSPDLGRV